LATYKRSIFIINPKFQFKLSFLVCFLVLVATTIYPITIYELVESFIKIAPEKAEVLAKTRENLFWVLALVQAGVLGLIFISMIFVSHKIAGPMYKLKTYLSSVRKSDQFSPVFFRNGDYFLDVADEVNETLSHISSKRNEDFAYLDEINSYIANLSLVVPDDKKPVLHKIQKKLLEIQNRHQ
jgi:hypothetical protein